MKKNLFNALAFSLRTRLQVVPGIVLILFLLPLQSFAVPDSFSSIVKTEKQIVVHIATTTVQKRPPELDPFFEKFFPNAPKERRSSALGSGFFISSDGYILTNNHVIEGAEKIYVYTVDEKKFDATLVGNDPKTDLALIKIEGTDFPAAKLGDSDLLEIGDWVIAIGNPLGLDFTVTAGIVSAFERSVLDTAYGQFIQTDAAINFGNSGGPLLNVKGEVVGINTAIAASGQGLSFAVPINISKNIIDQLKTKGSVERGWLGVGIQDLTFEMKAGLSLSENTKGVLVNQVGEDTPAMKSGIKQGDVIVEFNGNKTEKVGQLQQIVAETKPNSAVPVKLYRDGKMTTLSVRVGKFDETASNETESNRANTQLGFSVQYLTPSDAKTNGYPFPGALVTNVEPNKSAEEQGLERGDLIRQVNRQNFSSQQEFNQLVEKSRTRNILLLVYKPGRGSIFITVQK